MNIEVVLAELVVLLTWYNCNTIDHAHCCAVSTLSYLWEIIAEPLFDASHSHQLQLHNVLTLIITCQCTIFNTDMSYTGGNTSVFISPAVFILTNIAIIMASIYSISLSITITWNKDIIPITPKDSQPRELVHKKRAYEYTDSFKRNLFSID